MYAFKAVCAGAMGFLLPRFLIYCYCISSLQTRYLLPHCQSMGFCHDEGFLQICNHFFLGFHKVGEFPGIAVQLPSISWFISLLISRQSFFLRLHFLEGLSHLFVVLNKRLIIQFPVVCRWIVALQKCAAGFPGPFLLQRRLRLAIASSFVVTAAVTKNQTVQSEVVACTYSTFENSL